MKKVILCIAALSIILSVGDMYKAGAEKPVTLHFFYSPFCNHCKNAKKELEIFKKRYGNLRVIYHAYINQSGNRDMNVVRTAVAMLKGIQGGQSDKAFIFNYGVPHIFLVQRGLPYYQKKGGGLKKMINVPFFIINDKAFVGFDKMRLQKEITR